MHEQHTHEEEIAPGQQTPEPTRCAPRERLHEIGEVIAVAGNAPPARREQEGIMGLVVCRGVGTADKGWCGAPDS